MRNRVPSSVHLSNVGIADLRMGLSAAASASQPEHGVSKLLPGAASSGLRPRIMASDGVQDDGNSAPGALAAKPLPAKCSVLLRSTDASSPTRVRRLCTCARLESGGTKRSPSSRRSVKLGLNTALSSALSSSLNAEPASASRFDQNVSPTAMHASRGWQLQSSQPAGASSVSSVGVRSNWSRFRSTPWGSLLAEGTVAVGASTGGGAIAGGGGGTTMLVARSGIIRRVMGAGPRVSYDCPSFTRPRNRSRPNWTPPYTPCMREPNPFSAPMMLPSSIQIWEWHRSFQSWGMCCW
mmetsp:Transcript_69956/g.197396  ORF Transcript_69956/g.197396 Transcript_69956/m.197396 type:complete len:295 (+) Transcript_69956:614-1498(+)